VRALDLEHSPLAGLVRVVLGLRHDAVETGAFEALQPVHGHRVVARDRREVERGLGAIQQSLEPHPALGLRQMAKVLATGSEDIEGDEGSRNLRGEFLHPRRRGVEPELQGVEIEAPRGRDHHLAVHHASGRQARKEHVVHLREIAVERPEIAALDEDVVVAAEHESAKTVPFRLVEEATAVGHGSRDLRQHRIDRRLERKADEHGDARLRLLRGGLWYGFVGHVATLSFITDAAKEPPSFRDRKAEPGTLCCRGRAVLQEQKVPALRFAPAGTTGSREGEEIRPRSPSPPPASANENENENGGRSPR